MPRDHYVAQTYLKHFLDPSLGNLLHAYNKEDLVHFTPTTKNICCARDWDTNPFFKDERLIDQYLTVVEPKWDQGVEDIESLIENEEVKYCMAGYIAVLASCTPTVVRTSTQVTKEMATLRANILAQQMQDNPEKFPDVKPLPPETFKKIMDSGGIVADVDPKYTHARAMQNLVNLQWQFYKSPWVILHNETDSPFLTSDFPVAYYYPKLRTQTPYRFVPISPKFAVLIHLSLDPADKKSPTEPIEKYPTTIVDVSSIKPSFGKILNKLTIQGAEKFIISAYDEPWIMKVVKKYKDWRIDSGIVRSSDADGEIISFRNLPRKQSV